MRPWNQHLCPPDFPDCLCVWAVQQIGSDARCVIKNRALISSAQDHAHQATVNLANQDKTQAVPFRTKEHDLRSVQLKFIFNFPLNRIAGMLIPSSFSGPIFNSGSSDSLLCSNLQAESSPVHTSRRLTFSLKPRSRSWHQHSHSDLFPSSWYPSQQTSRKIMPCHSLIGRLGESWPISKEINPLNTLTQTSRSPFLT